MVEPPVISIETRTPELVDESYKRFLMKRFFEEFQLMGAPLRLNFDQKLILRKDEDLEQFTLSSNSVSAGVDSNSGLGRKNHTRNRHPSLRQQERRSNKRF
jgi:GTP-binding protein